MILSDMAVPEELQGWRNFAGALSEWDKTLVIEALESSRDYFPAIQAVDTPFTTESLLMSLMLAQHKEIARLTAELEGKAANDTRLDS